VKRALSNVAGQVLPPLRAQAAIREGAERAVRRAIAGELGVYRGEPAPYEIEVELRNPVPDAMRANLERLPEFEITGEKTLCTLAPDMSIGFRRIAYLGYAEREGVVRY
jgi:D-aminopeptidase